MKHALLVVSLALCLCALRAFAGSQSYGASTSNNTGPVVELNPPSVPLEFTIEDMNAGEGSVKRGGYRIEDFEENDFLVKFILLPRVKFGILRLGFNYERYDFGINDTSQVRNGVRGGRGPGRDAFGDTLPFLPLRAELPDDLQNANFIVGLDTEFSDSFLIRIEAHPGWYGGMRSHIFNGDNFRAPFIAGGTWVYSSTLQFTFGVGVDFEGRFPVLPGGGVRWAFAPEWVLNAVLPTPRLEYQPTKNLTVYAGAEIKSETFRTPSNFGFLAGDARFNNAWLNYTELRTGLGIEWKFADAFTLAAEGGYLPWRQFDYGRVKVRYHEDGGAPYGMLAFKAAF